MSLDTKLVILALSLATLLTFATLSDESIWLDESTSISSARDSTNLLELFRLHPHMRLYYTVLHYWIPIGETEFWARAPAAIFALLSIPVVFALGKSLFTPRVGSVAALLLAINPLFLYYAQEARSYSLVLLLTTLASFCFIRGLRQPSVLPWLGYVVSSALAFYAHFFGILVVGAHAVSLAFLPWRAVPWKKVCLSWTLIVVLILPPLLSMPLSADPISWVPRPSLRALPGTLSSMAGGSIILLLWYFPLSLVASLQGIRAFLATKLHGNTWHFAFILSWLLIPICGTFVVSMLFVPMLQPRYLIICLPALMLLPSIVVPHLNRKWVAVLGGVMVVLLGKSLFLQYTEQTKEDWRDAVQFVLAEAQPQDAVVFYAYFVREPFEYYLRRFGDPLKRLTPYDIALAHQTEKTIFGLQAPNLTLLNALAKKHPRVWLVLSHDESKHVRRYIGREMIQQTLEAQYDMEMERQFTGVRIVRYRR